jgi:hypothetical protein
MSRLPAGSPSWPQVVPRVAEFWIPAAAEFATWHPDARPVAVVRVLCNESHPVVEWWRTGSGDEHIWGGRETEGPPILSGQGVGYLGGPQNPVSPDAQYERTIVECPVCDYRLRLTPAGEQPVTRLLDELVSGRVPPAVQLAHPSGASAIAVRGSQLFRNQSARLPH